MLDNNCDAVIDCNDPLCASTALCGCVPGPTEVCNNNIDDNCDGKIDCADPNCAASPECVCDQFETSCTDGIDNDCDGLIDCGDPTCFNTPFCACQPTESNCNDTADNDCNGLVDCADPACASAPNCSCNQPEVCNDNKDNDCDGKIDCADKDCSASDYYVTECCNGIDANGNGIIDDFNCRCADDSTCPNGQFCYTHTVFACGLPCTAFFGDICKFVAPGSYCNANTQQCEF
jgi:hypothetical protein